MLKGNNTGAHGDYQDVNHQALNNAVVLIEDSGSIQANEWAQVLSKKLGLELHTIPASAKSSAAKKVGFKGAQWQLVFTEKGLCLRVASEPSWSDIRVDFASDALQYRKQHGGGRNESVAKAIGIKGKESINVLDCTAGMGTDSFIMASVGANVTMLERSIIIASLLDNALERANLEQVEVCERMSLINANAIEFLQESLEIAAHKNPPIDVIYLDPMFPHKKKSALVKKEMRAFQLLLGPDQDSEQLLSAAINFASHLAVSDHSSNNKPKRIVVKRPASAPCLSNTQGLQPSMAITAKKHRFDVYLIHHKA
jgi:16S rRNA (guanine1516-N2)-methyltransferase